MQPNRKPENDSFPELTPLENVLSTTRRDLQYRSWLNGSQSDEPQGSADPNDYDRSGQDVVSQLSPNLVADVQPSLWTRATESLRDGRSTSQRLMRLWQTRRGDFYLLMSVVILIVVVQHTIGFRSLTGQGSWASAKLHAAALELGIADRPRTVEAAQPEARVWVDFSSGVYYCPGSRKYGKTSNGQFTTEGNARLSQYEPATHKACK